ncbi:TetR/AcrR family transcriptional regulator [Aliarcobacter butzleri]|uniref:TetR/AcrR family transcriptional regulator n=1 Tax=Aliarcobacter butzleri TaxID=28197 RepID=UPI001EDF96A4|nr:TetR/AcrR family transcriptional regulator [Aliarcobacter butzleri]MCG3681982.1 TetR/AcrR family transcriptional regulator [Aliarcobacter butzleri]
MAIKKTSKEEILKESIKLFKTKGYYNCSMANIADACGLIKGSIYHYFKSKDEIGIESLKYIHNYFVDNIFSIAYKKDLSDLEKIKLFVKKTDEYFLKSEGGCLLGNLALEVGSENLEFRKVIKEYFSAWEDALIRILENKYSKVEAKNFAKEYVALIQGSIMMMNLYETPENYLKVGEKLISLF